MGPVPQFNSSEDSAQVASSRIKHNICQAEGEPTLLSDVLNGIFWCEIFHTDCVGYVMDILSD